MVRDLWRYSSLFLGRGRRRLLLEPPLALLIAMLETLQLLLLLRLLLALVNPGRRAVIDVAFVHLETTFSQLALAAASLAVVGVGLRITEARLVGSLAAEATRRARNAVFESYFAADWQNSRQERMGRLQQLLAVNSQQATTPVLSFGSLAMSSISLTIYGVIILVMAPLVALSFAILAVGVSAIFRPLRRRSKAVARAASSALRELQFTATSYVQLNRELHVFGANERAAEHLERMNNVISVSFRQVRINSRMIPALFQQFLLAGVLLIVVVAWQFRLDASAFGAAAVLALRSLSYVQQFNNASQQFIEARPFLEELRLAVIDQRNARRHRGDVEVRQVHRLELRDVHFSYADGQPALAGVSITVRRGEWLGVVGPSGGGKTTLANVVAGLLTPTQGKYLVNDYQAEDVLLTDWVMRFAMVSQEPVLLRATLAENIAFHRHVSTEQVEHAAELAAVRDEIEQQPNGFDTLVGDGSTTLSGGQRQRIALARALVTGPDVLILDEPTSALDSVNEAMLEETLRSLPEHTTAIVISHRPALLGRCDRFVRVEAGRVVAEGGPADVGLAALVRGADAG